MKAKALALFLSCLAFQAFSQARVDLSGIVSSDFMARPTVDQAASALGGGNPFWGFNWEVLMGSVGLGGDYLARFERSDQSIWWVDWDGLPLYASFHILGSRFFVDPYAYLGLGSAGRVGISPESSGDLSISIFPVVGAGASLRLGVLRLGAKLGYSLGDSPVPATAIPAYTLGRFQLAAYAGISLGAK